MADLFGRQDQVLAGGLSSDSMFLTWPALAAVDGGLGLLVQQVGIDYRQPVRRVFELGPGVAVANGAARAQPSYYIIGRPEGRFQMSKFVGANVLSACFYRTYGSACGPNVITLSGVVGCSPTDPRSRRMTWNMNGVILDGERFDLDGREMVVQEQVSAQFIGLDLVIDGDNGNC